MMTVETQLRIMERELKRKEEERVAAYNRGFAEGIAKGRAKVKAEGEAKGRAEGIASANESWQKLLIALVEDERFEDIKTIISDPEHRDKLMREYGIK